MVREGVKAMVQGVRMGIAWGEAIAGPLPLTRDWFAAKASRAGDMVAGVLFRVALRKHHRYVPHRSFPAWELACARSAAKARELGDEDLAREIES
jgi:hypothetical protein